MATWKLAPALAAGNAVVLKPAEQTPASILYLMSLIGDLLPAGVVNVVNGFGVEAGKPLASSNRIAKIAFTGETTTGRLIMQYASQNLIPVTLELGGKSPNIFFSDVMAANDDFQDKALEGFTMFALNQGEVCTCPSRSLIQADIYDEFLELAAIRTKAVRQGDPLDTETMIGSQASNDQLEKVLSYIEIGKDEGARVVTGGERAELGGDLNGGYYVQPTIFEGNNKMRIFQEEIFGPVVAVTSFNDYDDAIAIANDTLYGLGAGVWSRDGNTAYRAGRDIKAGRVWTNCYHAYPAHAAFGGYKQSGIGRENHKMMLDHYQQTKNLLVVLQQQGAGLLLMARCARARCARSPTRGRRPAGEAAGQARAGDVPPVRRLLRRVLADVLPRRRLHRRRPRRPAGRPRRRRRRGAGVDLRSAVRGVEAHPAGHRRRARPRRRVQPRGARGHAVPVAGPGVHRRRESGAGRQPAGDGRRLRTGRASPSRRHAHRRRSG